jgi:glycosyltransferase involved in cell wall biosynthesis
VKRFTVVIPTYNSARTLRRCLDSLSRQGDRPDEVVVVDDVRTTDETRDIAELFGTSLIVSEAGMAESRNEGFAAFPNDYMLSIDSDMWLSPSLIKDLRRAFGEGADALSIKETSVGSGYWARGRALDKKAVELTTYGISARAFRKDVFEAVGGYDPMLEAGEDLDLHQRIKTAGASMCHIDTSFIEHDEGSVCLTEAARKKFRYGQSIRAFEAKHGNTLSQGWSKRLSQGVWIGLRHDPFAVPAFLILKTTETAAALLGRSFDVQRHRTPGKIN